MERRIVISTNILLVAAIFSVSCLLTFTGLKTFEPWSQVTIMWDSGWPILHFIDHFHFERYLAAYFGLMLENIYPGTGFSIYIALFVALNTLLFRQVHTAFTGYPPSLFAYVIFLMTHLAMNGRGAIGWSGWLLCLDLYGRFSDPERAGPFMTVRNSCQLFFSVLFASVSSGVFVVVFISSALLIIRVLHASVRTPRLSLSRIFSIIFATAVIGYGIYRAIIYLLAVILKILLFFGSYSAVIVHGIGLIAKQYDISIMLLSGVIIVTVFIILWTFLRGRITPVLWPLLIIAMIGGAFGFTTLTLNIPLLLIFFSVLIRLTLSTLSPQPQT